MATTTTNSYHNLPETVRNLISGVAPSPSTGANEKDQGAVNSWLTRLQTTDVKAKLVELDKELVPRTYLVGNYLTVADVALYGVLHPFMVRTHDIGVPLRS